jgi:hypothetical protein
MSTFEPLEELRDTSVYPLRVKSSKVVTFKRYVHLDFDWFQRALSISPSAASVAVWLAYRRAVNKNYTFRFNYGALTRETGISRWTVARALQALQTAGLIQLTRRPGAYPIVAILGKSS